MADTQEYNRTDQKLLDEIWALKRAREVHEPEFYLARKAYDGQHFTAWSREERRLVDQTPKRKFFNQYPEIARQTDSFENFLLSTDFTFTVIPKLLSDQAAAKQSYMLSLLAKDRYDRLKGSTVFSDYIHDALLDNVSFLEVTPNDKKDDVEYRAYDAFDILFNPKIKVWADQRKVVKIVRKKIADLQTSKLYKTPNNYTGAGSNFYSWKDIYNNEKYSAFTNLDEDETLLFECFIITQNGLQIKTIDANGVVLRDDQYPNIKTIPLIPLRIHSGGWYQKSYVYRLIPMNRSMDTIGNRMEDMILRLAKGGWLVQNEEDPVPQMNEEIGQILKYESIPPEQIQIPPMPSFMMEFFMQMQSLSERYGMSAIMSGNFPMKGSSSLRANSMINSMTGLTQQSQSSAINNMKFATKQILEYTFQFLYEMWDTPKDVVYGDFMEHVPQFVSSKFKSLYSDQQDIIGIPSDFKRFEVEIDNALGYTLRERQDRALQLREAGLIKDDAVKKIFKLGSAGYLFEADEKPMWQSPELKALLDNFPNLTDEQQTAVITMLKAIGEQVGNQPITPEMQEQLPLEGMPGDTGQAATPAPAPAGPPPELPES